MPRRPNATQLTDQLDELRAALNAAKQVVPVVAEQARIAKGELVGRLPTSEHGADMEGFPPPHYADPTGETVINFRSPRDGSCDPTRDLERLAEWYGDVGRLLGSTRRLLNQAPAAAVSVMAGRSPRDGRTQEEAEQAKFVRTLTGSRCTVTEDHADEEPPFGPGQLRRGMCDRHRKQFWRWAEDAGISVEGVLAVDRATAVAKWRAEVYVDVGDISGGEPRPITDLGAYKTRGVRRVA